MTNRGDRELELLWHQTLEPYSSSSDHVVVVACSGGRDSVVAAELAARAAAMPIALAYVDHGMRSSDAIATDVACVRGHADRLAVDILVRSVGELVRAKLATLGREAAAREARYAALVDCCNSFAATHGRGHALLVTAHHRDDQAETVLLRLLSGRSALEPMGMSVSRELTDHVRLVRPLLGVDSLAIEQFAAAAQLEWVHDETNGDLSLSRNRIRQVVTPVLRGVDQAWSARFAYLADEVSEMTEALELLMPPSVAGIPGSDSHRWRRTDLVSAPAALVRLSVRSAVRRLATATRAPVSSIERAVRLLVADSAQSETSRTAGEFVACATAEEIVLERRVVRPIQSGYLCDVKQAVRISQEPEARVQSVATVGVENHWGPVTRPVIARDQRHGDRIRRNRRLEAVRSDTVTVVEDQQGIVLTVADSGDVLARDGVSCAAVHTEHVSGQYIGLQIQQRKVS